MGGGRSLSEPLLSPARAQLRRHSFGKLIVEGRRTALHAAEDLQHGRDLVTKTAHGQMWVGGGGGGGG